MSFSLTNGSRFLLFRYAALNSISKVIFGFQVKEGESVGMCSCSRDQKSDKSYHSMKGNKRYRSQRWCWYSYRTYGMNGTTFLTEEPATIAAQYTIMKVRVPWNWISDCLYRQGPVYEFDFSRKKIIRTNILRSIISPVSNNLITSIKRFPLKFVYFSFTIAKRVQSFLHITIDILNADEETLFWKHYSDNGIC